jgi:hypothetical protein
VHVLLRAAQHLRVVVLVVAAARQRAQVGEHRQHPVLARDQRGVARERVRARAVQVGDDALHLGVADVVAEHEPLEPAQVLAAALRGDRLRRRRVRREREPLAGRRRRPAVQRLERDEGRLRRDVHVRAGEDPAHAAAERSGQRRLHLHGLDDGDDVARLDLVAGSDRNRDDHRRREVAHEPAVVARDAVGDPVDLDEDVRALDRSERAVRAPSQLDPALVGAEALHAHLDRRAVHRHTVAARRDLRDRQAVGLAAVAKLDRAREAGAGVGASATRVGVEPGAVVGRLGLGEVDRRLQQRDVGVAHGDDLATEVQAVQPGRVDVAGPDLGSVEQLE